jgi:hypothetical protein
MVMATQPEEIIDDEPIEQPEDEQPVEQDNEAGDEPNSPPGTPEEEHDEIGWGGGKVEGAEEPEGIRNLRNRLREVERENKALKGKPQQEELGPYPEPEEFNYDDAAHQAAVVKWAERKVAIEARGKQQQAVAERQAARWSDQQRDLDNGFADLRVPGKDTARAMVEEEFAGEAFAYLVKAAGPKSAAYLYALGNSPEKRAELKALSDEGSWAEFIAKAALQSNEVTMQRRKPSTQPEQQHRGTSGGGAGNGEARLKALETEAEKTGVYTKLFEYKRQLRAAGKQI